MDELRVASEDEARIGAGDVSRCLYGFNMYIYIYTYGCLYGYMYVYIYIYNMYIWIAM